MKRVYHPTANTFEDVRDGDVDQWAEAGWLKNKPKHVTIPEGTHKPGEHPGFATVPVLGNTETPAGTGSRPAKKAAAAPAVATKTAASGTSAGAVK